MTTHNNDNEWFANHVKNDELMIEALAWWRQSKQRYARADFRVSHSGGTYGFVGRGRIDDATLDHLDIDVSELDYMEDEA